MKNKDFFYLQYNKIDWKNQEKTRLNSFINDYIIRNVISNHKGDSISIFDIGFGIGFFIKMLLSALSRKYKNIIIEGCEPSRVNYDYFLEKKPKRISQGITINTYKKTFQGVHTDTKFDFITATYVFPHFLSEELEEIVKKIYSMLNNGGKFILTVANEEYIEKKLQTEKDLFIEKRNITYSDKQYKEIQHYNDIPQIGRVVVYNREESYYLDLFKDNKFELASREDINDTGFIGTLFVFEKR